MRQTHRPSWPKLSQVLNYKGNENPNLQYKDLTLDHHNFVISRMTESSEVMMMEADVSLGWLYGQIPAVDPRVPIMAHPPAFLSDLSLEEFLTKTMNATGHGAKKGIKLDFKSTEVAKEGLSMAKKYADQVRTSS